MSTTPSLTCTRCGAVIAPGAHFCASCGLDISSSQGGVATIRVDSPLVAVRADALLQALRDATLGEYEVVGELGRGGMATVYLAHDIALDRKVAIKVMSPTLMAGEGMAERFKREARTAGQLSHPHIIPIYAVREHGDLLYFVMKFIAGRSLDSIIREVGPMPVPMVQTILQQVGSALGYAHRRGVIHRDIKPANVMLDSEGWAVVTDFGIAKVSETQGLTLTGATVGTPSYMSPEQCAAKELSGASDQYSLGVVAYEMLSGKLPFVAESVMAVMYAHFNEPPPPITLTRADCPPGLAEAVMRMLEKDPAHRFPSMEAATAAVGAAPLAPDDPIRTQMITLAAQGEHVKLLDRVSTPVSQPSLVYGVGTSGGRPQLATLMIAPARVTVATGEAVQLRATAKSRTGKTIGSLPVTWASTNSDIAQVGPNGLVNAVAPGTVTITASSGNTSATAVVTVVAARRPARRLVLLGGGVGLAAIAGAVLLFRPFSGPRSAGGATDSLAQGTPDTTPQVAVAPNPAPAPVDTPARRQPVDSQPGRPRDAGSPPAAARDSSESTVATALASAQSARDAAVAAGARGTDLTGGDAEVQLASNLRRQGRRAQAFEHLRTATSLFAAAESTATARRRPPPETAVAPVTPPPPQPPPPPDPAPIRGLIASYGRALERRDLAALRQVYPGIPSQKVQQWQDFFKIARDVRATIEPGQIVFDSAGDRATASVQCTLRFQNTTMGRRDTQPCDFRARVGRQGTTWVIEAIQ
ncbi:MAG TPA: protein kinase [Gemmatimonadales bacterium]|nr:protein kinase [Gemmatimonadales bacterium]